MYRDALIEAQAQKVGASLEELLLENVINYIGQRIENREEVNAALVVHECGKIIDKIDGVLRQECDRTLLQQIEFQRVARVKVLLGEGKELREAYPLAGFAKWEQCQVAFQKYAGVSLDDYLNDLRAEQAGAEETCGQDELAYDPFA